MCSVNTAEKGELDDKDINVSKIEPVASFTRDNIGKNNLITTFTSPTGRVISVTGDVDEAMKIAIDIDDIAYDENEDKRLFRKINIYLLPLICILYACQFMDKVSTSYAAVMGFRDAFNMVGDMYSWCGTAFYLGYLFFEFPANTLIQHFPLAKVTAAFIILWGMILCLHSACKTYAAIVALRVILGILESAVTPAMVIITGQWYKKEEQMFITSIWFSFNGLGTIMGGAIAYGLASHSESYSIASWKILFIVTGLMTLFIGICFLFHVPDDPSKAWFLNDQEKKLVVLRIKNNQQGFGNKHFKLGQFKEALTDVQTWLFFIFAVASNIPNGSLTNFGSILLNSDFGYSSEDSLLMNMPCGAVELVGCMGLAYFSQKHSRLLISLISMIIALICACLLSFAGNKTARLVGYYVQFVYPVTMICSLSCFSSNTAGHTKKITTNAIYLIGYCVGNLVGPQTFVAKQAPSYTGGKISIVVCDCISLVIICLNYFVYWNRNRIRNKDITVDKAETSVACIENYQFADMTDKENPYFRYCL